MLYEVITYLPLYADKKLIIYNPTYYFDYFNGDTIINAKTFIKVYLGHRSHELFSHTGGENPALHTNLDSVILKNLEGLHFLVREDTIARKVYKISELGKNT